VATEGAVRGAVRALAGTLGGLLERRQEGARLLELAVFRADGAVRRIAVETGRPTRDPEVVERLFRERSMRSPIPSTRASASTSCGSPPTGSSPCAPGP
jgi:hypothetical protein